MSRLGRDYLKVGQCMERLREKGVRLIAINDNADSSYREDDFTLLEISGMNGMQEIHQKKSNRLSNPKAKVEHTASPPLALIGRWFYENVNNGHVKNVEYNGKAEGEDFISQLTDEEMVELSRCKNFTSSWGGLRYLPNALCLYRTRYLYAYDDIKR